MKTRKISIIENKNLIISLMNFDRCVEDWSFGLTNWYHRRTVTSVDWRLAHLQAMTMIVSLSPITNCSNTLLSVRSNTDLRFHNVWLRRRWWKTMGQLSDHISQCSARSSPNCFLFENWSWWSHKLDSFGYRYVTERQSSVNRCRRAVSDKRDALDDVAVNEPYFKAINKILVLVRGILERESS